MLYTRRLLQRLLLCGYNQALDVGGYICYLIDIYIGPWSRLFVRFGLAWACRSGSKKLEMLNKMCKRCAGLVC